MKDSYPLKAYFQDIVKLDPSIEVVLDRAATVIVQHTRYREDQLAQHKHGRSKAQEVISRETE